MMLFLIMHNINVLPVRLFSGNLFCGFFFFGDLMTRTTQLLQNDNLGERNSPKVSAFLVELKHFPAI